MTITATKAGETRSAERAIPGILERGGDGRDRRARRQQGETKIDGGGYTLAADLQHAIAVLLRRGDRGMAPEYYLG